MARPAILLVLGTGWFLASTSTTPAWAQDSSISLGRLSPAALSDVNLDGSTGIATEWSLAVQKGQPVRPKAPSNEPLPEIKRSKKSMFLSALHTDVMWLPTSSGNDALGLVGAHFTVANIGRVYLYGPPGVLLLRDSSEGVRFHPALTWGFSFHLADFKIGPKHTVRLFANMTKVWTRGDY